MERLADYISRVTKLESERKGSRDQSIANPVEQDSGRNSSGQRDAGGDRQDSSAHRREIRQAERQD